MTLSRDRDDHMVPVALDDALEVLLRLGAALLRAGHTAYRVRKYMSSMARSMRLDALSATITPAYEPHTKPLIVMTDRE
jgi:hypothetical protein